jgi:integrase
VASIEKDGKTGRWLVRYDAPRGPDGRRRQKMRRGFRTKREAEQFLAETTVAIARAAYVQPQRRTLDGFAAEWFAAVQLALAPTTLSHYRRLYAAYVRPALGGVQLQQLTASQLAACYAGLRTHSGRPLAAGTVRGVHTFLHRLLADAVEANLLVRNPADGVHKRLPKLTRRPATVWTPEETGAFLDHVREHRLYAAFLVFATTGARRSEVLGLRWAGVDLVAARMAVTSKLVVVDGHPRLLDGTKTERSTRAIDLDPFTVAALRAHRRRQREERLAWGAAWTDHGLVFCQENGAPLHPAWFRLTFGRLARDAGLPPVRLHDLRHGWATAALHAGVHPKVVQERLGHASIAITLNTYSHVLPGLGREAAATVADAILGAVPGSM